MKVWVTRDVDLDLVEVNTGDKPYQDEDGDFFGNGVNIGTLCPEECKKVFGFTPRKGSCKQYELSLEEIK